MACLFPPITAVAAIVALAFIAHAEATSTVVEPSWQVYGCNDKGFAVKPAHDTRSKLVLEAGGRAEILSPVYNTAGSGEERYTGKGDLTLTIAADGRASLEGADVAHGPYFKCQPVQRVEGRWDVFRCEGGLSVALVFEFTSFIALSAGEGEILLTRAPAAGQDLFDGVYKHDERDVTLTIAEGSLMIAGADAPGGARHNCKNAYAP